MMNTNKPGLLIGLSVATVLACAAAVWISAGNPASGIPNNNGLALPELHDHVNDVNSIKLTIANNQTAVTLSKTARGWVVQEKSHYPADSGKLRGLLLSLADAVLWEQKTANPQHYAELAVDDVKNEGGKGVMVSLDGLGKPVQLIVGAVSQTGNGTFVRRPEAQQSWLVRGQLSVGHEADDWLDKTVLDIPAADITEIRLTQAGGKPVVLAKAATPATGYQLTPLPPGRELKPENEINELATALSLLNFTDVKSVSELPLPSEQQLLKARYQTKDGLVVDVNAWRQQDNHYVQLAAGLLEPNKASKELWEKNEKLQQRLNGWTFLISKADYGKMDKGLEDMLKPLKAEAKGK